MKKLEGSARISSQKKLLNLLTTEFRDGRLASELFDELLRHRTYSKSFCQKLFELARQGSGTSWDIRRLACLMLEHEILKLDPEALDDFDFLFTNLGLKEAGGSNQKIVNSVLKEGYTTTNLRDFIPEFRRKLERLDRVQKRIRGRRTPDSALREFIELSRRECKISIARYLFTPEEVVDQILRQLRVTAGVRDIDTSPPHFMDSEIQHAIDLLPDFEARILNLLGQRSNVYWVSEATSSNLNSLVEYPLTTVVLVVKPPGSDIEFEIKRAGRRGLNPLDVVFRRNGNNVAPSHRLDGGSMQWLLRYEARHATKLNSIYRLVHATEAPMPTYIRRTTISSVPVAGAQVAAFRYFTEPRVFGDRFRQMRMEMETAVAALEREEGKNLPDLSGEMALTGEFLSHVAPAQAILSGTSSFRIDKLAIYLSAKGSERYFKDYLGINFNQEAERQFADELLDEVLGVYNSPNVPFENFEQYLSAAFAVSENRAIADRIFVTLVREIAKFWGTLLAIRGHSRGESFVARNVGLRSSWEQGQWKVKIIFMDHDGMSLPELENGHFYAKTGLPGMLLDERHVWGRANPELFPVSLVGYFQSIYRIGSELAQETQSLAMAELKDAYRKTQQALLTDPKMRAFFSQTFIDRLFDWDKFVSGYLQRSDKALSRMWEKEMKEMFAAKGYERDAFDYYMEAAEKHNGFLERTSFLYDVFNREPGVAFNG
jgi:hypothetical protein